jgi:hypothetical protein
MNIERSAYSPNWPRLEIDVGRHNDAVLQVWDAYYSGNPSRVPMILGSTARVLLLDPTYNPERVTFRDYFENPQLMFAWQVRHADWVRSCLLQDAEMGTPADGWEIDVDFQNVPDAAWFGNQISYIENQVPDTISSLQDKNKLEILDRNPPEPFDGIMGRFLEYYEFFVDASLNFEYKGVGIKHIGIPHGDYTDGPFTTACKLRGSGEFCLDLALDPKFARDLLKYITDATIHRFRVWREHFPIDPYNFKLADDLILLLSEEHYREFVLPHHRRLFEALLPMDGKRFMHLCGDHGRFFQLIHENLGVTIFDTGFPMDFGRARAELGKEVTIRGGPSVQLLLEGTVADLRRETRRILESGIMEGGQFILREANDLPPGTPLENTHIMYETTRQFGRYAR